MLLFSADGKGIVYDDTAIDNLLDRNQVGEESTEGGGGGGVENLLANEYLGSFKVGLVCLLFFFSKGLNWDVVRGMGLCVLV